MSEIEQLVYQSLLKDYILSYIIDLEANTIDLLKKEEEEGTFGMEEHAVYSDFHAKYALSHLHEDYRDERFKNGTVEYLRDYLGKHDSFEYLYLTNYGKYRKAVYHCLERKGKEATKVLLSFVRIENDSEYDFLAIKGAELELANSRQLEMIQCLAGDYETCYYVDLSEDTFDIFRMNDYMTERFRRAFETYVNYRYTNGFNMFLNLKGDWFSKDLFTSLQTTTPDLILNTAMMFPIGYGVSHITKNNSAKKAINSVAISLALSLGIEFLQFMLPISRVPSVLDVILNSASGLIGAGAYLTVNKIINNKAKEQQLENKKELGTEFDKIKENNKQNVLQNSQESVKAKITPKKEIEIISLREELGLRNKAIENKTIERENIEREN